jgi:hypothetical protein
MQLKWLPLIAIIPFIVSCVPAGTSPWRPYFFNGNEFQPSVAGTAQKLWLRKGYLPRLDEPGTYAVDTGKLPPGTGAVAGICYLQTSGGKLGNNTDNTTVKPYPDEQVVIKNRQEGISVTRTDEAGYFIEALFPGDYELLCRGAAKPITVIKGETTLVPLRGGKRMAD